MISYIISKIFHYLSVAFDWMSYGCNKTERWFLTRGWQTKKEIRFKMVCNSCMLCKKPTNDPNPFYICNECKKRNKILSDVVDSVMSNKEEI